MTESAPASQADPKPLPEHLYRERQDSEEFGVFVYHEDIRWWEFVETFPQRVAAVQRARKIAQDGEAVAVLRREVIRLPWTRVMEAMPDVEPA